MRYAEDPEADYDRLAGQQGPFSVVKDGAKIPLSKADYVKLMQDFAEEKGFQDLILGSEFLCLDLKGAAALRASRVP